MGEIRKVNIYLKQWDLCYGRHSCYKIIEKESTMEERGTKGVFRISLVSQGRGREWYFKLKEQYNSALAVDTWPKISPVKETATMSH